MNMVLQNVCDLTARVDVVHVSIEHHLQKHPRIERRRAARLVGPKQFREVKAVNYLAQKSHGGVLGN